MILFSLFISCTEYKVYPEPDDNLPPDDTAEPVSEEPMIPVALAGVSQEAKRAVSIMFDGTTSYDPDDETATLQYQWTLESQPEGSTVSFIDTETATPKIAGDLLGDYVVSLVVTDEDALVSEPSFTMLSVVPYEHLIVNLTWDVSELDLDLHLLRPDGTYYSEGDCFFANPEPDWGITGDIMDNPMLLTDDEGWEARESIELLRPEESTYTILVHHYNQRDAAIPYTTPHIEIVGDGVVISATDTPRLTSEGLVMTIGKVDWRTQSFEADFSITDHITMGGPIYNE